MEYKATYLDEDGQEHSTESFLAPSDTHAVRAVLWGDLMCDEKIASWLLFEGDREITPADNDYLWSPPGNYRWQITRI